MMGGYKTRREDTRPMPNAFAAYVSVTAPTQRNLKSGLENLVRSWNDDETCLEEAAAR